MKLRNKKTGEAWNVWSFYDGNEAVNLKYFTDDGQVNLEYNSLTQLNEDWEDYKPKEPLIKDPKIRKAVKAWLEANDLDGASYYTSSHFWYLRSFNDHEQAIDFWLSYNAEPKMVENKYYTIAELCGEEEK